MNKLMVAVLVGLMILLTASGLAFAKQYYLPSSTVSRGLVIEANESEFTLENGILIFHGVSGFSGREMTADHFAFYNGSALVDGNNAEVLALAGLPSDINDVIARMEANEPNLSAVMATKVAFDANHSAWDNAVARLDINDPNWDSAYSWTLAGHSAWDNAAARLDANDVNWDLAWAWIDANHSDWDWVLAAVEANDSSWDWVVSAVETNDIIWDNAASRVDSNQADWDNAVARLDSNQMAWDAKLDAEVDPCHALWLSTFDNNETDPCFAGWFSTFDANESDPCFTAWHDSLGTDPNAEVDPCFAEWLSTFDNNETDPCFALLTFNSPLIRTGDVVDLNFPASTNPASVKWTIATNPDVNVFGADSNLLGLPAKWVDVSIDGVIYVSPCYIKQ